MRRTLGQWPIRAVRKVTGWVESLKWVESLNMVTVTKI